MKTSSNQPTQFQALRARAETALRNQRESTTNESGVHELRVHEVELRMQNEALRELQIELSIARERYRELFEHAPIAYVVLQRDSTICKANAAAAALIGLGRHQLAGRKLSSFIDPSHTERFALHARATFDTDGVEQVELSLRLATGAREVRLESSRSPVDPREWRVALIDVTSSRQLERQLERARRLEAIGTFTSGIAHDFRGVLAIVSAGADLALEQGQTGGDPLVPIRRVKQAAKQGSAIVRQLLRFASGSESDTSATYPLDSAIRNAEALIRELVGDKVTLCLDLRAQGANVSLDLGGPDEILFNLAANAEQAMPEGGVLSITTRIADSHVGLDPNAPLRSYAVLSVKDDGVGMDLATQRRAFEPFFTTQPTGKGTGLGLAMVYGIIKRAGGHVKLTSEVGKGTTFDIYLPAVTARST